MKGWKTEKACHYVVVIFEADNIKRWKEYTEELYKKDPNDLDNHEGVITHLKPDILECKVGFRKHHYEQSKRHLNDLDNHDGVISHLEPDILEYEASLQTKLMEVMEFQLSYFRS